MNHNQDAPTLYKPQERSNQETPFLASQDIESAY